MYDAPNPRYRHRGITSTVMRRRRGTKHERAHLARIKQPQRVNRALDRLHQCHGPRTELLDEELPLPDADAVLSCT